MSEVKGIAKSAIIMVIVISLVSKVLGFLRETVIAAGFGASYVTDAYVVALTIPTVIFKSFSNTLQTTFIPIFTEILHNNGKKEAFFFTNIVLNTIILVLTLLSLFLFIFMPQITTVIAPGFKGEIFNLTVKLARIMLPVGVLWGVVGIASGILKSLRIFTVPAAVGITYNLIIIISVISLGKIWGITGLAIGTVLGVLSQIIVQIPWLKSRGMNWEFRLQLSHPALKKLGLLLIPILVSTVVVQLNVVIDRLLASRLPEGSISALNFANRLNGFVLGIFVFALVTVVFPVISQKAVAGEIEDFKRILMRTIRLILFLTVPTTAIIVVLKVPIIRLLFQRGAFDSNDTIATATAFFYYGLGLTAFGVREIVNAAYFALQDTRTPMVVGISSLVLNIILNLVLVRYLAHGGLALATSIAAIVYVSFILFLLHRKLQGINGRELIHTLVKIVAAGFTMGIVMEYIKRIFLYPMGGSWITQLTYVGGLSILGFLSYIIMSVILKIEEVHMIYQLIKGEFEKLVRNF